MFGTFELITSIGTRTSYIDGFRTGPMGKHAGSSHSNFIIDDTKARVFVAPTNFNSEEQGLKPYVQRNAEITKPWSRLVTENLVRSIAPNEDAEDKAREILEPTTQSLRAFKELPGGLNRKNKGEEKLLKSAFGKKRVSKLLLTKNVNGPSKHSRLTYASGMNADRYKRLTDQLKSLKA